MSSLLITQHQNQRNYATKRMREAAEKLKHMQAEALTVGSETRSAILIDMISCQKIEIERWRRDSEYHSMLIKDYREAGL